MMMMDPRDHGAIQKATVVTGFQVVMGKKYGESERYRKTKRTYCTYSTYIPGGMLYWSQKQATHAKTRRSGIRDSIFDKQKQTNLN